MSRYPPAPVEGLSPLGRGLGNLGTNDLVQRHTVLHAERQVPRLLIVKDPDRKDLFSGSANRFPYPPSMYELQTPPHRVERRARRIELELTDPLITIDGPIDFEDLVEVVLKMLVRVNCSANKERLHAMPLSVITDMEKPFNGVRIRIRAIEPHKGRLQQQLLERGICVMSHRIADDDLATALS